MVNPNTPTKHKAHMDPTFSDNISAGLTEPVFHELSNGMRLALWPQPHLHSLGIGLYVRMGPRFEHPEHMGISHFLEHILFRGNERYPSSLEMNRAFEAWGGSINAYTTREYTYFYGKLHPGYLSEAAAFMGALLRGPKFADVDLERQIILEERLQDVDTDGQILEEDDISRQHFWKGHALGNPIIGTPKSLKMISEQDLRNCFERHYGASNLVLCLTGCFDPEAAIPLIEQAFADLSGGEKRSLPAPPKPNHPTERSAFVYHDSNQVSLLLSFRGAAPSDQAFLAMLVLDRILDDGMSSRLWQSLVERKGLCYDLWASIDCYSDASIFEVGASVAPERVLPLVEGICEQLLMLKQDGPTEEEFALAKRRWCLNQSFVLDKVGELNEHLGAQVLFDQYRPLDRQIEQLASLTLQDLIQVAQQLFCFDNLLLTAVGPLTKSLKRRLREAIQTLS